MDKPASLQDAVVKSLITQSQADEFRRLVESGDIIGLLLSAEMTITSLQDKVSEAITAIETLKTDIELI